MYTGIYTSTLFQIHSPFFSFESSQLQINAFAPPVLGLNKDFSPAMLVRLIKDTSCSTEALGVSL